MMEIINFVISVLSAHPKISITLIVFLVLTIPIIVLRKNITIGKVKITGSKIGFGIKSLCSRIIKRNKKEEELPHIFATPYKGNSPHNNMSLGSGNYRYGHYDFDVTKFTSSDYLRDDFIIVKDIEKEVLLFIGDLVGNGTDIISYIGFLSALFLSSEGKIPSTILKKITHLYLKVKPDGTDFTCCCIRLKSDGHVSYSGFMERIVINRKGILAPKYKITRGPLIGLNSDYNFETEEFSLQDGDGFSIYTDGIYSKDKTDRSVVTVTYNPHHVIL